MNYLLSIIVPTKDRYEYLIPLLRLFTSFESNLFEFIVQDNSSDNNEILKYLDDNQDVRIKYFYTKKQLSIIENCDKAISNTTGEYVCFIGDDDGVLPWILDVCKWMKKHKIDGIYTNIMDYIWPDLAGKYSFSNISGSLTVKKFTKRIKKIEATQEIQRVLKKGATEMLLLPRVYQGIISKKVLNEVIEETKSYFPGPSPDMANAIAVSLSMENYYYIDFPLIISGAGRKGGVGLTVQNKHEGLIDNIKHLPETTSSEWTAIIPKFWSGSTIWAQSTIISFKRMKSTTLSKNINIAYLYAKCLVYNKLYRDLTMECVNDYCKETKKNKPIFLLKIGINFIKVYFSRLKTLIKNILVKYGLGGNIIKQYKGVNDINQAINIITNEYSEIVKPWDDANK